MENKILPPYIQDIRFKHPQIAIEHLYERKEQYKKLALKYQNDLSILGENLYKHKFKIKQEKNMNRWLKNYCVGISVGFVVLFAVFLILFFSNHKVESNKMPVSGKFQKTGNHILSSVNIYNGGIQGSGVILSKGESHALLLSAAHNFAGKIGGNFWVYYPDGTYTEGTLLAIDRDRDLSLCRVDPKTVLAHSYIPKEIFTGDLSGVGYSGGKGPNYRKLIYEKSYYQNKKYMWEFTVESGPFWSGDSGSGVFIDEACVGIAISKSDSNKLHACSLDEIVKFLKENTQNINEFGDYHEKEPILAENGDSPPPWKPSPNIPIYTECKLEKMISDLRLQIEELKKNEKITEGIGLIRPSEIK